LNYKLINGSLNDINKVKETILLNRGIENYKEYLNLTDDCLYDYSLLDNMDKAVKCLLKHIENKSNIHIIPDVDVDGYTSAAMIYMYLKKLDNNISITYSIHTKKQHGLSDDIIIPEGTNLIIIPDAGSNDIEQCKKLKEKGIDIIILDHHKIDNEINDDLELIENKIIDYNSYAIVVNNQICDYKNKFLSGVGISYKFLQAIDDYTWNNYADNYLDLVALGNIGDSMDLRSLETKRLIDKGLNKIRNKFFKSLINKQSYSIGNTNNITINNIQFYISPLINAMVRAGDSDEKDLMFRAFIETDEMFKYKPRRKSKDDPEPEEIDESIYDRAARLCVNAKNRQNKSNDANLNEIFDYIQEKGYNKNKIIIANITNKLNETATGLSAMKVANRFGKPCLLLRKSKDDENIYGGSGRNEDRKLILDLKTFLEETGQFEYVRGHDNSFGVSIKKENIKNAINIINEKLKDVDFSPYDSVDFIIDIEDLDIKFIREIDDLKSFWGEGIKESKIVIKNVKVCINHIQFFEKTNITMKFVYNDEINFIMFKVPEDDEIFKIKKDEDRSGEVLTLDVIGKASINSFNGILSAQIMIDDYEIVEEME
jgi:single-stranded-DNA-specific exonuclease